MAVGVRVWGGAIMMVGSLLGRLGVPAGLCFPSSAIHTVTQLPATSPPSMPGGSETQRSEPGQL